jgi:hypothetical protein
VCDEQSEPFQPWLEPSPTVLKSDYHSDIKTAVSLSFFKESSFSANAYFEQKMDTRRKNGAILTVLARYLINIHRK